MTAAPAKPLSPADLSADLDAEIAAYRLLNQLRRAGFTFKVEGGDLHVAPPGQLDLLQRQALKTHKAQIIHLLKIEARPAPIQAAQTWTQLPPAPPPICCGDCRHSATPPTTDPVYGWKTCGLGIDGGGGLGRQDRQCGRFEGLQQQAQEVRK